MEKLLSKWPKQLGRFYRFDQYLEKRLSKLETRQLTSEIGILQTVLDGAYEKVYPLSTIKQYLPGKDTFKLLDTEGQIAIAGKRSPLSLLKGYLLQNEKLRN